MPEVLCAASAAAHVDHGQNDDCRSRRGRERSYGTVAGRGVSLCPCMSTGSLAQTICPTVACHPQWVYGMV